MGKGNTVRHTSEDAPLARLSKQVDYSSAMHAANGDPLEKVLVVLRVRSATIEDKDQRLAKGVDLSKVSHPEPLLQAIATLLRNSRHIK